MLPGSTLRVTGDLLKCCWLWRHWRHDCDILMFPSNIGLVWSFGGVGFVGHERSIPGTVMRNMVMVISWVVLWAFLEALRHTKECFSITFFMLDGILTEYFYAEYDECHLVRRVQLVVGCF